ncbi:phosphoribosylanthranilate isomerase [uncultured Croceitalea sp.]|uniref:phosphoribosylanthranilate isomerase n=1 Tax=uncultured Croceitalea sp. TaxID=1798908 RepID=UPI0033060D0C
MKLKVCGMKYNPKEVAALQPDYLGFIFWERSKRFFEGQLPQLPEQTKKVGVFVDATISDVLEKIKVYHLDAVQLHGSESVTYCHELKEIISKTKATSNHKSSIGLATTKIGLIKVFSIKNEFDFSVLAPYEAVCDYFLFDTKGKLPGGNGYTFDWSVLKNYPSTKPYFLSGGIGPENTDELLDFLDSPAAKYCHAIDVNSRFESEPGLKNIEALEEFKKTLITDY